jgi:hypothetical protein
MIRAIVAENQAHHRAALKVYGRTSRSVNIAVRNRTNLIGVPTHQGSHALPVAG